LYRQQEIRQMLAQEPSGGAIVNASSVNGLGGVPQAALYAAAKAGVIALTNSAALEYTRQGVRINALVAGAFEPPMLEGGINRVSGGKPEGSAEVARLRGDDRGAVAVLRCRFVRHRRLHDRG
jgi:NAD(P)-dependent dehydrogenase (short-subunit alcohol dehydrogenase family)